jgi:multidrug resistance efflux pump
VASQFSRTLQSLEADGARRWAWGLAVLGLLLAAWAVWFFLARVSVLVATGEARLEVQREPYPVESEVDGRVAAVRAVLGQEVEAGQILVELDREAQSLRADEELRRQSSLAQEIAALRAQLASQETALAESRQADVRALEEAEAREREAAEVARLAALEAERLERLFAAGTVARAELDRARAAAVVRRSSTDAVAAAARRLRWTVRQQASDRQAALDGIRRDLARLEGQRTGSAAVLARLRSEVGRRVVRAPVAGRIGELAPLRPGTVLAGGERIGTVIPSGGLRAVAPFPPGMALGRIAPGQRAWMRLEGFPWTQYGTLPATVSRVASEVRGGRVRVECRLDPGAAFPVALQHGLPGTVEIEVERVSPAVLALRNAGRLAGPAPRRGSAP